MYKMYNENGAGFAIKFREKLIKYSTSKDFLIAKNEWMDLTKSKLLDKNIMKFVNNPDEFSQLLRLSEYTPGYCVCGKNIKDYQLIENTLNHNRIIIGNHCIIHINNSNLNQDTAKYYNSIYKELKSYKNLIGDTKKNEYIEDCYKCFKKPSGKLISIGFEKKLINQDEFDFLKNIPNNYKKSKFINMTLNDLEKMLYLQYKIYDGVYNSNNYEPNINYTLFQLINTNDNWLIKDEYFKNKLNFGLEQCLSEHEKYGDTLLLDHPIYTFKRLEDQYYTGRNKIIKEYEIFPLFNILTKLPFGKYKNSSIIDIIYKHNDLKYLEFIFSQDKYGTEYYYNEPSILKNINFVITLINFINFVQLFVKKYNDVQTKIIQEFVNTHPLTLLNNVIPFGQYKGDTYINIINKDIKYLKYVFSPNCYGYKNCNKLIVDIINNI